MLCLQKMLCINKLGTEMAVLFPELSLEHMTALEASDVEDQ